jgi:hypothetical protein
MTREEYVKLLQTTTRPQCRGRMTFMGSCCALGLVGLALGYDEDKLWESTSVVQTMGLSPIEIIRANDGGFSFKQIAYKILSGELDILPEATLVVGESGWYS